ncbi:MAG: SpoIIE family protein phosphatase [Lachnospiraceae bacterium]|nr:SpoIIE family protein phosphatase [Lachnospiraceae bacterium]
MKHKKRKISLVITIWLVVIVMMACVASAVITYLLLSKRSENQAAALVRRHVKDVSKDINDIVNESIILTLNGIIEKKHIGSAKLEDPDEISKELQDYYGGSGIEVNVIDANGIIIASSVPEYIGYDMHAGEQASEFLCLLDGSTEEFIQDIRGVSYDESIRMKYAGKRFADGSGFLEVGITGEIYYEEIGRQGKYATTNRHIGETGYLLVCDSELNIIDSYQNTHTGKSLADAGIVLDPAADYSFVDERCDVFGVPSFVNINEVNGLYVIGVYPVGETIENVNTMMYVSIFLEVVVFAVLFVALIVLLRKLIVDNLVKVKDALTQITEGNLDERIEVRDTYEFDILSTDINVTVDKLKGYIAEAAARIDADLEVAKAIQTSVLPNVFPPFPERHEFELFASMHAAKEVGGDFYDFFMIGRDTLGFLIADVSGKSIPGAMFMMRGKAVIKNLAESGLPPADVFSIANEKLCEGNDAEMFLTAWMGYLDLNSGIVHVANAGHNPPVLVREGKAEYVILKPGLMLAGMEGMIYKENSMQLNKGDILYLYTDGVTEAMDADENQYGEDRLIELLSFGDNYPAPSGDNGIAGAVCEMVSTDIDKFVQGAEQSDDITMLCIRYLGEE